jgi:hypothetical protein
MTYPKTNWNYSRLTEALRILQIAHHIKNQFYIKKSFFVLPYNIRQYPKVIFFPKLPYQKIKNFWVKAKTDSESLLSRKDPIIDNIIKFLPNGDLDYSQLRKGWARVEKHFWSYAFKNYAVYFKNVKSLEVRPTSFGSVATAYSTWIKSDDQRIVVYIRSDADFSHIAEAIFLDRFYKKLINLHNYSWEEIEAIIDFLLTETELARLFGKYKMTLGYLKQSQQGKIAKDSKKYLQFLGFPVGRVFEIRNGRIFVKNQSIGLSLSPKEEKVFRLLISHRKEIVSYDDLAEVIWGEESYDKFSVYAITKLIQRLREKIELMGIFPEIIQTVKKKGYILID